MDRIVPATYKGQTYYLNYSISVLFDTTDKYGSTSKVLELMKQQTREAFEAAKWCFARMAKDGELVRRKQGYDAGPILEDSNIDEFDLTPLEFIEMSTAVAQAVSKAYEREVDSQEDETDVGLQELSKKKVNSGA